MTKSGYISVDSLFPKPKYLRPRPNDFILLVYVQINCLILTLTKS